MYKVALIQNDSEMSHYSYANSEPMLKKFGYQVSLYTNHNIRELSSDVVNRKFDAIIFASNSLNNKEIIKIVLSDRFKKPFNDFIKKGKGCLILHQYKLSQDNKAINFLPKDLKRVEPQIRDKNEKVSEGEFRLSSRADKSICLLYPNLIDFKKIKEHCTKNKNLKGLYWHFWSEVNSTYWDSLLYDASNKIKRPLIISSKKSKPYRILLCSLPIDYQKQKDLFGNLLTYIVEGIHDTALLIGSKNRNIGFEYFIGRLNSKKYPHRIYDMIKDENKCKDELERNIKNGIHKNVVLGPFVPYNEINDSTNSTLSNYIKDGKINLIKIKSEKISMAGQDRFFQKLFQELLLKANEELKQGYIDDSFWSTFESLQTINRLKEYVIKCYNKDFLAKVFERTQSNYMRGSYDDTFGASCALFWLYATYYDENTRKIGAILNWIKTNIKGQENREKVFAYSIILDTKYSEDLDESNLKDLLDPQRVELSDLNEIDLALYFKSSVKLKDPEIIISSLEILQEKQKDGIWSDLVTTATVVSALLEAYDFLKNKAELKMIK